MPLRFLTSGGSHGPALLAILDGMPAGLPLEAPAMNAELARRQQGYGAGPRMKIEQDLAKILGGVMEGLTTGAPHLWPDGLVIFAMQSMHAAYAVAFTNTGIVIATLIAVVWLRERERWRTRHAAAAVIVAGLGVLAGP